MPSDKIFYRTIMAIFEIELYFYIVEYKVEYAQL